MTRQAPAKLITPAKIAGAFGIGFGFFAGAGVTGLSLLLGALGIWALVYGLASQGRPLVAAIAATLSRRWLTWLSFLSFVIWVMISAAWSPAQELAGESIRRLSAMVILGPLVVWALASLAVHDYALARRAVLGGLGIAFFILCFEIFSDAAINKVASPEKDALAIDGDLGRAATATLSLFWVGFACLKQDQGGARPLLGMCAIAIGVSLQFGTDLNAVGLVLGSCAALLALSLPRFTIAALSASCAVMMIAAPLLLPLLTKVAAQIVPKGQFPISYGRREQMWSLAADLIAQKPLKGWGLGASSTFDKTITYAGFQWPEIQLHPHSAPLHIWLETGAVGAILASIAIITAGATAISVFGRHKIAASAFVGGATFLALQWGFSHSAWREWMWTSFAALIAFSFVLRERRAKPRLPAEDDV